MAVEQQIQKIEQALVGRNLSQFAREAGLPYTTVRDWQKASWRTKHVETFDALVTAAERLTKGATA